MDVFLNSLGNAVVLLGDPTLWAFILGGFLWGCLAGALPGISSVLAIGVVIPLTFSMDAPSAIGLIIGISVGMSYGNSIPAILLGVPPHASAVLTAADGYALHKQGKSGKALAAQWLAATYGQLLSVFFFVAMVVPLSLLAYSFLSPELFALYLLGITALVALTGKSVAKGFVAAAVGFVIALVGPDPVGSVPRLEFGLIELRGGITEVAAVLGLLAGSELLRSMRQTYNWGSVSKDFSSKFMSRKEVLHVLRPMTIGGVLGSLLGAIPGFSGPAATFVAYQQAKLTSKTPELFGNGSLEGIASNEAAQNAAQGGEMVPTLGLGIPAKPEMVLLLGALTIQGLVPGPLLITQSPVALYAAVAGLIGSTVLLAVLGWPLAKGLLRVATLDRGVVLSLGFIASVLGVYALARNTVDVTVFLACSAIGYVMLRYGYSTAAAAITVVLAQGLETNLRQGLLLMNSDWVTFFTRPWTAGIVVLAVLLLVLGVRGNIKLSRQTRIAEATPAPLPEQERRLDESSHPRT